MYRFLFSRPAFALIGFFIYIRSLMQGLAKQSGHIMTTSTPATVQQEINYEAFSVVSFQDNKSGTKDASLRPLSVKREWDEEIFSIGDRVTNGTKMVGDITGFEFLEGKIFVNHTWSGVGMNLGSLQKVKAESSTYRDSYLCRFGNFLFKRYGVMVHSSDGKNQPIYQREVSHADLENWKSESEFNNHELYPSRYEIGQYVWFRLWSADIAATILCVHFYEGKVKYDLELLGKDGDKTRIYNVDSCYVQDKIAEKADKN